MRTTIEMAREAAGDDWGLFQEFMPEIHRLAELVRADERARMAEQPAQQQEPVAWIVEDQSGERLEWAGDAHSCHGVPTFPLYTSPPAQRTWVGLTDEEITDIWAEASPYYHEDDFARAIEAKLKQRNT